MTSEFLGRIPFAQALREEEAAFQLVKSGASAGVLLGFECEPVITLGVRASAADFLGSEDAVAARGFSIAKVSRGGQATLHNPGQLVIFPVCPINTIGARCWVQGLGMVTRAYLIERGLPCEWDEENPGLYTSGGKIMACGVRIRQGISTHGIAINVSNNLADFDLIRACGKERAPLDRMGLGFEPRSVFAGWVEKFLVHFQPQLTR